MRWGGACRGAGRRTATTTSMTAPARSTRQKRARPRPSGRAHPARVLASSASVAARAISPAPRAETARSATSRTPRRSAPSPLSGSRSACAVRWAAPTSVMAVAAAGSVRSQVRVVVLEGGLLVGLADRLRHRQAGLLRGLLHRGGGGTERRDGLLHAPGAVEVPDRHRVAEPLRRDPGAVPGVERGVGLAGGGARGELLGLRGREHPLREDLRGVLDPTTALHEVEPVGPVRPASARRDEPGRVVGPLAAYPGSDDGRELLVVERAEQLGHHPVGGGVGVAVDVGGPAPRVALPGVQGHRVGAGPGDLRVRAGRAAGVLDGALGHRLGQALVEPALLEALAGDPGVRELVEDQVVVELLADDDLVARRVEPAVVAAQRRGGVLPDPLEATRPGVAHEILEGGEAAAHGVLDEGGPLGVVGEGLEGQREVLDVDRPLARLLRVPEGDRCPEPAVEGVLGGGVRRRVAVAGRQ